MCNTPEKYNYPDSEERESKLDLLAEKLMENDAWLDLILKFCGRLEARSAAMNVLNDPLSNDVSELAKMLEVFSDSCALANCGKLWQ